MVIMDLLCLLKPFVKLRNEKTRRLVYHEFSCSISEAIGAIAVVSMGFWVSFRFKLESFC